MFACKRFATFTLQKIHLVNKLQWCCYFLAGSDTFVKKARTLEAMKQKENFPPSIYENAKYILFCKSENVCLQDNQKLRYINFRDILGLKKYGTLKTVFLDVLNNTNSEECLFAMDVEVKDDSIIEQIENEVVGKFLNIRRSMYFLDQAESEYVTQARGLINFCTAYKFCCFCGGSLAVKEGGHQKKCTKCNHVHYPTLSPIGITLIEDEKHEEVLLVRQERHPPGMYTCVAGFIEPGESLEKNAKREIAEEVGLTAHKIEYCVSQHWALPSCQLVLGCIATSKKKEIDIDTKEILDAKWVKAKDLIEAVLRVRRIKDINEMSGEVLWAPPRNAVSHELMLTWLKKHHNFELPATDDYNNPS